MRASGGVVDDDEELRLLHPFADFNTGRRLSSCKFQVAGSKLRAAGVFLTLNGRPGTLNFNSDSR
jgi:hypothetical protein